MATKTQQWIGEGMEKKGGVKPEATTTRPNIVPTSQNPPQTAVTRTTQNQKESQKSD